MNPLRKAVDRWLGRGEASITTPPMDGAFRPNDLLDSASTILETPEPDCLAVTSRGLVVSSERSLLQRRQAGRRAARFLRRRDQRPGRIAGRRRGGRPDRRPDRLRRRPARRKDDRGQPGGDVHHRARARARRRAARRQWLGDERAGRLEARPDGEKRLGVGVAARTRQRRVASNWRANLAYPYGLLEEAEFDRRFGKLAQRADANLARRDGRNEPVLENLPAYPSRLSRGADNAIWLALFAPRSQLVEFVLSEDRYRRRMIERDRRRSLGRAMPSLGPLAAGADAAGRRQAARRAEALVAQPILWSGRRVSIMRYRPIASLHSRANGRRHGVTSCLAIDGRLFFSAKGDGVVAARACEGSTP